MVIANPPRSQALSALLGQISKLSSETIKIEDCCGRIVSEDIISTCKRPAFNRSMRDGFAISKKDLKNFDSLKINSEIRPSTTKPHFHINGTAARVLTGAIIPNGADWIVPVEETIINGNSITIKNLPTKDFISKQGAEIESNEVIISQNTQLNASHAALLSYAETLKIGVYKKPKIKVLGIGNELCDPYKIAKEGLITADNLVLLKDLSKNIGVDSIDIEICSNSEKDIAETIKQLTEYDIVVTVGGTGPGKRDFVYDAIIKSGAEPIFKGVKMHPAKSLFAAKLENSIIIGTPGPPHAVNIAFHLFIKPAIRKLMGHSVPLFTKVHACQQMQADTIFTKIHDCIISESNGSLKAELISKEKYSPRMASIISNGLIVLPPSNKTYQCNELVDVVKY